MSRQDETVRCCKNCEHWNWVEEVEQLPDESECMRFPQYVRRKKYQLCGEFKTKPGNKK